ncbi:MAG: LLM class F420-dependent oxidoreductase [Myxococcota bacterium]
MRFSVQLPTDRVDAGDEFVSAAAIREMAQAVEAAGFDACYVTDHPFPGDRWLASGGHHALDPWIALSFAAAATERLRLQTNIIVIGYRNPFLTAKAVSSLDVLSEGRVILGVAAGYLKPEFRALGADFDNRNDIADEALRAMKRAFTEDGVELIGREWAATGNTMRPRPVQQPHPPIWVGGNSRRAIRRAVELADGWVPFPTPGIPSDRVRTASIENLDDLDARIAYAREHAQAVGREAPLDISFIPFGVTMHRKEPVEPSRFAEVVDSLGARGVTWLTLAMPAESRAEYCEAVARFGEEVLRPLR